MVATPKMSLLIVSVDLNSAKTQQNTNHSSEIRRVASRLVKLFNKYNVPSTWAANDPGRDFQTAMLSSESDGHEVALDGRSIWPDANISRANFAGELQRSIDRAHQSDLEIRSVMGVDVASENTDLLVKHDISALKGRKVHAGRSVDWTAPQQIRFGVWDISESARFPFSKSWMRDFGPSRYKRMVRQASARQMTFHLVVDMERVLESESSHLHALEGTLDVAARYERMSQIRLTTLSGSVKHLSRRPTKQSARSVLRAA